METWRKVWREGIAPQLSTVGLEALREGLADDDPNLIQGETAQPMPLVCTQDWPVEKACALAYPFWKDGSNRVIEVEVAFFKACFTCDASLGEPCGCRWFINWWDDTPREEARRLLLEEVRLTLKGRQAGGDQDNRVA